MNSVIQPDTKFTPTINSVLEPQIDWAHRAVILGRDRQTVTELGLDGTMDLGVICEHQGTGASLFGYEIKFDNKFPHIIFICGKRGSGKSYTLGVIVEELGRSNTGIGTVVIDPLGTFWTMKNKTDSEKAAKILPKYGLYPKDFKNIRVLAPIGFFEDMKSSVDGAFSISVSDLGVDDWCLVFDIDRFKTQGLLIGDVLDKIYNGYDAKVGEVTKRIPPKSKGYNIGDIIFCIKNDVSINSSQEGYALATRRSVIARFRAAAKWGIFSVSGTPINQISIKNKITILDVSHSQLGSSRRALIVGIIARKILEARIESSRKEEALSMGLIKEVKEIIPVTWLIIDEAHLLLPASGKTPATKSLIEYAKLGRKPGCGLVFATQRPSATNDEILSQVDSIFGHNLALEDDITALRRRIPAKIPDEFDTSDFIRGIPVGVCLLADQKTQKRTMLVQIRPRITHHSGKAAVPKIVETEDLEKEMKIEITEGDLKKPLLEPEPILDLIVNDDILKPTVDITPFTRTSINKEDTVKKGIETVIEMKEDIDEGDLSSESKKHDISIKLKTPTKTLSSVNLNWGGAYLISSKGSEFALDIFKNKLKDSSGTGFYITRTHPSKLDITGFTEGLNTIWLSKTTEKDTIPPGNITKIAHVINEHLKVNEKSLVLLDGLEYLINNNDFQRILKFIESIHEKIVINKGILLIPVNPLTMSKKNFELLESELVNTLIDPTLEVEDEIIPEKVPEISAVKSKTRSPTKAELKNMCSKLGLKTTGSIEELKQRLLTHDSGEVTLVPEMKSEITREKVESPPEKEIKKFSKVEDKMGEADHETLKALEKERKALLAERKKLQDELIKLKKVELKRKMESERKKLDQARNKLEREKNLLEERQKELAKQIQKIPVKRSQQDKPFVKPEPAIRKPSRPTEKAKKTLPKLQKKPFHPSRAIDTSGIIRGKKLAKQVVLTRRPLEKKSESKKTLVIKARLKGTSIEEFAVKQIKTTIFGKPLEAIKNIKPVYLPLLRLHIKTMRGSIFAKEYPGMFYWDQVTGEIITDVGSILKRSKGIATLIKLTPNQAKVLAAMDTWGSNDVVDLQNEINIPMSEIKRALTGLRKKSMVVQEMQPDKKIYNYKRMVELKFPKKLEKIKVDMPTIIHSDLIDENISPQFKLSEFEKLMNNLMPGTRIVNIEEVYYPYFALEIVGKEGPRIVLLDANTGNNDKILTEAIQFQK